MVDRHADRYEEMVEASLRAQREIAQALHAAADPVWLSLDLTMVQLKALFVLAEDAGLTVGGLAGQLGVGKPAASILVERLVQLELVARTEDIEDRRRTLVRLTAQGQALVEQLRQGGADRLRSLLVQLDLADLAALAQGLQALARVAGTGADKIAAPA
jgi:DNA-binding MarR family transcriptional regulator